MISVIICHHKGDLIKKAIESLQASREVGFEIIVATSGDKEHIDVLRSHYPDVQFVEMKGGPAHKRNIACRYAKGNILAFFDDDIEATPYALFYLKEALLGHGCSFGKLRNMEFRDRFDEAGSFLTSSGFLWARAESGIRDIGQFERDECILAGKSAAMMIRRHVFWQVGGFDASYEILGEETDLAWRVWLYGFSVVYAPKSLSYHAFNTRFKPIDFYVPRRVYFNGCRNYISMLFTNLGNLRLSVVLPTQFIVWMLAGMGMLVTGKFEAGINIFKGLWYVVSHFPSLLLKRGIVQKNRKISDVKLMKIILRNPPFEYYYKRFFHYIKTGRHG